MSYSDKKPDLDAFLDDNGDDRLSATAGEEVETREGFGDLFRETESRGTRTRTLNVKGLIYQLEVKDRKRNHALRQLQAKSESIRSLFIEVTTSHEKELMFSHWLTLYEHFLDAFEEYNMLLADEDKDKDRDDWLKPHDEQFQAFKHSTQKWIVDSKHQPVYTEDARSHTSRTSKKSRGSHVSSMGSILSSERFREEQKKAELIVKAAALQKKREIEQARLRLRFEEEELEIESQIAISNSITKVVNKFQSMMEPTPFPSRTRFSSTAPLEAKASIILDPAVPLFVPRKQVTVSSDITVHELETPALDNIRVNDDDKSVVSSFSHKSSNDVTMAVVRHLRKPVSDLRKFDGNPLEYRKFMRQFRSKIVNNSEDDDERLNFLEQYTIGEAHRIVVGLSYLEADVGYRAAMKELEERYGDPEVVVNPFLELACHQSQ
jgi:hypothetical protein